MTGNQRSNTQMTDRELVQLSKIFQALSHPMRLRIILLLMKKESAVWQICEHLDAEQHRVSQQLLVLRKSGLVKSRRASRQMHYSLAGLHVAAIMDNLIAKTVMTKPDALNTGQQLTDAGQFSQIL